MSAQTKKRISEKRGQMSLEYLFGLAIVTGVVLWGFSTLIPKIYTPPDPDNPAAGDPDGYAEKYFKTTAEKLLGPKPGN